MKTIAGTTWMVEDARAYILARVKLDENGCWLWIRSRRGGYGAVHRQERGNRRSMVAHRVSFEAFVGLIPNGMLVCHQCDTPACCNPDHLFVGTHADNMRDRNSKSRTAHGERSGGSRLTANQVRAIYADSRPQKIIAADFGITQGLVSHIKRGRVWRAVTGHQEADR